MTPKTDAFPTLIFADGASSGNPGPSGWGSVIVTPDGQVTELGGRAESSTNNRMEMTGVMRALDELPKDSRPIAVYTDSVYVIRGITQWAFAWMKRGWKTAEGEEVANQDLWKQLIGAVSGRKIDWGFVRGHSGIPGNERVDQIAVAFSKFGNCRLYRGPLLGYGIAIHDIPEDTRLPEMKPRVEKAVAHSYLSLVGGVPVRHRTWPECERRVKGVSGAKFKKAATPEDESQILAGWGYDLSNLRES